MLDGLTDFLGFHGETGHEVNNLLYVYRRFVGRSLQDIWLMFEVAILLAIDKRYATGGIFTILQGFDDGDARTMTT